LTVLLTPRPLRWPFTDAHRHRSVWWVGGAPCMVLYCATATWSSVGLQYFTSGTHCGWTYPTTVCRTAPHDVGGHRSFSVSSHSPPSVTSSRSGVVRASSLLSFRPLRHCHCHRRPTATVNPPAPRFPPSHPLAVLCCTATDGRHSRVHNGRIGTTPRTCTRTVLHYAALISLVGTDG
jgi:hypothetical protein